MDKIRCIWQNKQLVLFVLLLFTTVCFICRENERKVISRGCQMSMLSDDEEKKMVALTFDDGPHPIYTKQLLDGLSLRNVEATFFVVGENIEKCPELLVKMHNDGHLIGNHTYSHMQLQKNKMEEFKEELLKTNHIIEELTGKTTIFVRPPYGIWDDELEELNMIPILWTIDPMDWCSSDTDQIVEKIMSEVQDNSIILLHDLYPTTIEAVWRLIEELEKEGYTFVNVEKIVLNY